MYEIAASVAEFLKHNIELWLSVLVGAFATWFFVKQCWSSFTFLHRLHAGTSRGSASRILMLLIHVAWQRPRSLFSSEQPFLKFVRIRAEHEIFDPRPVWKWPLPDDDTGYGRGAFALDIRGKQGRRLLEIRKKARKAAWQHFEEQRHEWRERMREVLNDTDPESETKTRMVITVEHAGQLNDELSTIKRYFDTLKTLSVKHGGELKFFCAVDVKIGFIASQHLLAGLLVRYHQNWGTIIYGFERDTNLGDAGAKGVSRDVRQIQSFIYHCWLLWGPSIPVCSHSCAGWDADFATLQFGYGDENNAIEIVGETRFLREQMEAHIDRLGERAKDAMALPAGVRGRLQYSSIIDLDTRTIPPALRSSWSGTETERPVLFLSRESDDDGDEYPSVGRIRREDYGDEGGPGPSRYYSAYLWVMFVLLRFDGKSWKPMYFKEAERDEFAPGSGEPWKATLPFFEHGNMADAETCAFSKRQLAVKTLNGILEMARLSGEKKLKFAYSCAIDDANCSQPLAFDELVGGKTVREMLEDMLDDGSDPKMKRAKALIDFDFYKPAAKGPWNPHSACSQTEWVRQHYINLDRTLEEEATG